VSLNGKHPMISSIYSQVFAERSHGIRNVGAIDGCHILIKQPLQNANDYFNRKQFHSIILQGKELFTNFMQSIKRNYH